MRLMFAAMLLALAAAPALAMEVLAGNAMALDGDTIEVDGEKVDLWGIEAPELSAPNGDGRAARDALDGLLAESERVVNCGVFHRRRGYPLGVCRATGDLGAAMIETGWAVENKAYTSDGRAPELAARYSAAESQARTAGRGRWARRPEDGQ